MSKKLAWIFTVALLTMANIAAEAQVKVIFGDDGKESYYGTGGKITYSQTDPDNGKVTVTITASPNEGFTINKEDIHVYEVISPNMTRAGEPPVLGKRLDLDGPEGDMSTQTDYSVTIDEKLGLWVKKAEFQVDKRDGAKATTMDFNLPNGYYYLGNEAGDNGVDKYDGSNFEANYYMCPAYSTTKNANNYLGGDKDKPLITTFKSFSDNTKTYSWAVWYIEAATGDNADYFYIRHRDTGQYLVANDNTSPAANRRRVNLGPTTKPDGNDALFRIQSDDKGVTYYIFPKEKNFVDGSNNDNKYLNPSKANLDYIYATSDNSNTGGILGFYFKKTTNSLWHFVSVPYNAPVITNNFDGTLTITAETGLTIYYTTDGSTPTTSSPNTGTTSVNVNQTENMKVVKAIAYSSGNGYSPSPITTYELPKCDMPVISISSGTVTISTTTEGASICYTVDNTAPTSSSTLYNGPFSLGSIVVIRAIAVKNGYAKSEEASYMDFKTVSSSSEMNNMSGLYRLANGFTSTAAIGTESEPFKGIIDGQMNTISGLDHPLVAYANGATIKNVMLKGVQISGSGNVGAIVGEASGYTRIYNCGILPSDNKYENESSYVSSSDGNCGGLVGWLKDDSRVINCFSYANITGGTTVAGIVGYNNFASTAEESDGKYAKLKTAVVNCMFYGNITGGTTRYPVYGGEKILNNTATGINNYDFYRAEANLGLADNSHYNCSWPAQEEYLTKYEYYRYLLNSNRELCGWWVGAPSAPSGMLIADVQAVEKDASLMAKWVLDPSIAPYPILKAPGKYYSAINQDPDNRINPVSKTWESRPTSENTITTKAAPDTEGQKLGSITVTINKGGSLSGSSSKSIPITAMDIENNDFCYGKIQLPYYNSIFGDPNSNDWTTRYGGNYRDQVVVGWEITSVTGGTEGTLVKNWQDGYNFADRDCTNKDKERIFAQGGYYYVPNGVTAITITAKWADATYLDNNDSYYDRVSVSSITNGTASSTFSPFAPAGTRSTTLANGKTVRTGAILSNLLSGDVYEKAIVLVGNNQNFTGDKNYGSSSNGFTVMSADFDLDDEPDYSLIWQLGNQTSRYSICPIRFDFLPVIEMGMAMKEDGSTQYYSLGCYRPLGHFEVTETSLIHFGQFEFGNDKRTLEAPLILNGGIYDQYTKGTMGMGTADDKINYIIIGGNVRIPSFTPGAHPSDRASAVKPTRHCALNVMGGNIDYLYLTGNYNENITPNQDNPHCYIDGGNFKQVAAAGKEGIDGDVFFNINHSVIEEFYGGSTMDQSTGNNFKTVKGDINVTVDNSKITKYCGGPKFGNMNLDAVTPANNKKVTTNATGTTFGVYYGGGNGGTSYVQYDKTDVTEANAQNPYDWNGGSKGKLNSYNPTSYRSAGKNYVADYEMEIVNSSAGTDANKGIFRTYFYAAQFSATNTGPITNNLTNCKVLTSFYGGGNLGGVIGDVTSTLTDTEVMGSAFGAGYSASVPEVTIYNKNKTAPTLNVYTGIITPTPDPDPNSTSTTYTWTNKTSLGGQTLSTSNPAVLDVDGVNYFYTEESLENLGTVTGDVTLNINGNTTVGKSVYGGGEESNVMGNTNVTMTDGYVFNGIFGGGYSGSVGTFTTSTNVTDFGHIPNHDGCIGKPVLCAANTGKCTVVVTGGQIGPIEVATKGMKRPVNEGGPVPEGWVWGGGCGIIEDPKTHPDTHFKTYVGSTDVTIGGEAFILESIIGGGEFGRVLGDTHVTIEGNCQIGVGEGQVDGGKPVRYADEKFINPATTTITNDNALPECSHFEYGYDFDGDGNPEYLTFDPYYDKYYDLTSGSHKDNIPDGLKLGSTSNACDGKTWIGCVFGGGSGYFPYEKEDGSGYGWVRSAGWVEGNTSVEITGGHILTNVYGANEYTDVKGKSTVRMSGGTVGVPRTLDQIKANPLNGNIFGAGKGDPRTNFNEITNVDSTVVEITGGIIYGSVYGGGEDGHVTGDAVTTIGKETTTNEVITKTGPVIGCVSTSDKNGNVFGGGMGAVSALTSGVVGGNVTLGIVGGQILGSVYGGGQIASVGSHFTDIANENYGKMQAGDDHGCLTVNLTGGTIDQNVYGGCMGANADASKGVTEEFAAKLGISKNVVVNLNQNVDDNAQGCAVKGSIFGCNNVNSSPEGTVEVYVYGTQHAGKSQIANTGGDNPVTDAKTKGSYDVHAVYGGGNLAAYIPKNLITGTTNVIIDGCGRTSIQQVYGGGNAASTPATSVTVNGTFEIEEVFGGGNGKDAIGKDAQGNDIPNPGANVGFYDYSAVEDTYPTKEDRQADAFTSKYVYGSGKASVNIFGGTIHRVFGGSNTKGNVRQTAVTMLEEAGGCEFCVDEAYGGGKSAPMDAEAKLLMSCIPGLQAAYGGAEAADIQGNVTLNITNGTFDRVFGGNNLSGTISGSITVNIEEVGCKPVKIGELYGGGNQAAYSVYGYDNGTIKESGTRLYNDPVVNVKSFTSIGSVFGGGYGEGATLVGNPTVNINEVYGKYYNDDASVVGENAKTSGNYPIPSHAKGKMGAINNVFGGGNAARVIGNTTVNIGTRDKIDYVTTESGESTPRTNITVVGADIRSNVYGGGNNAEVTGNAEVVIGKKKTD